jgi:K+-transporting ATPase KdpF subunit
MIATILLAVPYPTVVSTPLGYWVGALIAFLLFGYLVYSLIKPEKF